MERMTAEKAVKLLAEHGTNLSLVEATIVVEFLRKLAKIAVAQYLRAETDLPQENEDDFTKKNSLIFCYVDSRFVHQGIHG
jgi:hypothetical protein